MFPPLDSRVMECLDTVEGNIINAQCIMSTTQPPISSKGKIVGKKY